MTERRFGSVHVALMPRSSRASHLPFCVSVTPNISALGSWKGKGSEWDVPGQEFPTGDAVCREEMKLYHHLADREIHSGCFREGV